MNGGLLGSFVATRMYCARCLNTFSEDGTHCQNLACNAKKPAGGWPVVLGPGDFIDRHYRVERTLAVGGAGITYLASELDAKDEPAGPMLAVKVLFDQRDSGPFLRRLANEAQILQELAHEHIVECRGFVQRAGHPPYLVTRFERGGSLYDHVKEHNGVPPHIAAALVRQILLALDVAHQRGVVHRDLKPQNVFLRELVGRDELPHSLVADFGIAKIEGGLGEGITRVGGFVGTPEYAAPEQFLGQTPTPATDLWAAGVVLWFLLTGESPFRFTHRNDIGSSLDEMIRSLPLRFPEGLGTSAEMAPLQDVLDALLRENPEERWTAWQVLGHLRELIGETAMPDRRAGPTRAPAPRAAPSADSADATFIDGGLGFDENAITASPTSTISSQGTLSPTLSGAPAAPARRVPAPAPRPAPARPAAATVPQRSLITLPDAPIRPSAAAPPVERSPRPGVPPTPIAAPPREVAPPRPRELSLDDLFGAPRPADEYDDAPKGVFDSEPTAPAQAVMNELPASATGRMSMRPPVARPPPPQEAPARPVLQQRVEPSDVFFPYCPPDPIPLPDVLPADAGRLCELLASVRPADRPAVVAALQPLPAPLLANVARSLRLGSSAALMRGVGLAIAALVRVDLAPNTRALLTDPDPGVRICAAEAVAVIGRGAMLPPLQKLLADPDPAVRIAAASAVARACKANDKIDMGRKWLEPLATDSSEDVRRAGRAAAVLFES